MQEYHILIWILKAELVGKSRDCENSKCNYNDRSSSPQSESCQRYNKQNSQPFKKKVRITLEAWSGRNGIIFPSGYVKVAKGNDITFLIKAEEGYCIQDIMVDDERITDDRIVIERQERYCLSFHHVTCPCRVDAYFMKK